MKIMTRMDRRLIRAGASSDRYVHVQLEAHEAPSTSQRDPLNLAIVLDRSGSMSHEKLRLAHEAAARAIELLKERDRFAVVVYDDEIDVVSPSRPATPESRRTAMAALSRVHARGSTNLAGGWLTGAEQLALHQREEYVQRCLLLTDGLANVGMVDPDEIENHAAQLRKRGIATSTFGIGVDFNEVLLDAMARSGGGNFYYVESAPQIADFLTSELKEVLEVVARDVEIEVEAGPAVEVQALRLVREAGRRVRVGDLVSDQQMDILLHFRFPPGAIGETMAAAIRIHGRDGVMADISPLEWEYADHAANDRQPRDRQVDLLVASWYAAQARKEAVALNRTGQFSEAQARLEAVRGRIARYAGDDPEMRALVESLVVEQEEFCASIAELDLKMKYYQASNLVRSRDSRGFAKRKRPG